MDPCTSSIALSKTTLRNSLAQRKVLLKAALHKGRDYLRCRCGTIAVRAGGSYLCTV